MKNGFWNRKPFAKRDFRNKFCFKNKKPRYLWRGCSLNPIGEDIEFNNKYTLITKEDCPHCKNAKEYLQKQNINYSEINYKQATKFLNTFNIKSVPVLVLKKERSIEVINGDINIEQCLQDLNFAENKNNLFDLTRKNLSFNPLENGIIPQENPSGCSIDQKALDCEKKKIKSYIFYKTLNITEYYILKEKS